MPFELKRKQIFALLVALLYTVASYSMGSDETLVQQVIVHKDYSQERIMYWYNATNQKVLEITQTSPQGDSWTNTAAVEWIYNDRAILTEQYHKTWVEGNWHTHTTHAYQYQDDSLLLEHTIHYEEVPLARNTYSYNAAGQLVQHQCYGAQAAQWMLHSTHDYEYDAHTAQLAVLTQRTHTGDAEAFKTSFLYADSLHTKPLKQTIQILDGESWVNREQYTTYYHPVTKQVAMLNKSLWQRTDSGYAWVNYQNTAYTYQGEQLTTETHQRWQTEFWQNDLQYTYEYAADGTMMRRTTRLPIYNQWRNISSLYYDYKQSPRREIVESLYEFWGGETDSPNTAYMPFVFNQIDNVETKIGNKLEITYRKETSVDAFPDFLSTPISIYPNPSHGIYYVELHGEPLTSWTLYNLGGNLVQQQLSVQATGMIDITAQPNGMYLLQVHTPSGIYTQRIVKQ